MPVTLEGFRDLDLSLGPVDEALEEKIPLWAYSIGSRVGPPPSIVDHPILQRQILDQLRQESSRVAFYGTLFQSPRLHWAPKHPTLWARLNRPVEVL